MSDVMLLGVLRMPYDLAMQDVISRIAFHSRAAEAAGRIEADADEIARLRAEVERLKNDLAFAHASRLSAEDALAEERAHADALAEALAASTDELMSYAHSEYDGVWSDEDFDTIEAPYLTKLLQHRARRQG